MLTLFCTRIEHLCHSYVNCAFYLDNNCIFMYTNAKYGILRLNIHSGGTRIFCGGHRGGKMRFWGGKNPKICRKWLILAIFFFWLGESGGQSLWLGGGQMPRCPPPPWCRHWTFILYCTISKVGWPRGLGVLPPNQWKSMPTFVVRVPLEQLRAAGN